MSSAASLSSSPFGKGVPSDCRGFVAGQSFQRPARASACSVMRSTLKLSSTIACAVTSVLHQSPRLFVLVRKDRLYAQSCQETQGVGSFQSGQVSTIHRSDSWALC